MLIDKLRVAQHAARDLTRDRGRILAARLSGALRILEQLVEVIDRGDGKSAQKLARNYNVHVRRQIVAILSASLGDEIVLVPPDDRTERAAIPAQSHMSEERGQKQRARRNL
jgi:hypothetical protein